MTFNGLELKDLIKTKYTKPKIAGSFIPRPRLVEKLNQALSKKVTVVCAPAGYGKSTAVLEWLAKQPLRTAWVSLDCKDNDPYVFWQYILCALSDINGDILSDAGYVFSSRELFEANIHLNIMLDRLEAEDSDVFLILDDFHVITEPCILDSLAYFVHYFPSHMHLLLISRSTPGMQLAHLEIEGQLARLTADDLRFQRAEIIRFFEKRGFCLKDADLGSIERHSEGWAASLVAIALSMDGSPRRLQVNEGILYSNKNLDQYLLEEVYKAWPEEKKTFFLRTSILDSLCGSLCNAVTGYDNSDNLLVSLNRGNSFLIPLDEKNGWYRYHPIFRDFLCCLLADSAADTLPDLYKRSADWYRENGYSRLSIEHYLLGGYYEEAVKLIEEQSVLLIDSGDCSSALSWINRLPTTYACNSLEIAAILATYYAETGDFASSKRWISTMEAIAVSSKYSTNDSKNFAQNACGLVKAHTLSLEGDLIGVNALLKAVAGSAGAHYNLIQYMDFNPYDIYFYRCPRSNLITVLAKRPDIYEEMLGNYQALLQNNPPGYGPLILGEYLYEKDRLDESMEQLLSAMEKAENARCPGVLVPSMVTIARINLARGDIEGAFSAVDECELKLQSIKKMHWNYLLRAFRARLCLDSGGPDAGKEWFESCKLGIYHEITRGREFELIVNARFLIAAGRMNEAEILLNRLLAFSMNFRRKHSAVEILNLLADACFKGGKKEKAMEYLGKSIAMGLSEDYIRSFTDEGGAMEILLGHFTAKGKKERAYVQSLIKHMPGNAPQVKEEAADALMPGSKRLTRQEHKVLLLLAEGNTNQQIANQLNISLSTSKVHILNIFCKLQVTTRIQCMNQARRLGLLP